MKKAKRVAGKQSQGCFKFFKWKICPSSIHIRLPGCGVRSQINYRCAIKEEGKKATIWGAKQSVKYARRSTRSHTVALWVILCIISGCVWPLRPPPPQRASISVSTDRANLNLFRPLSPAAFNIRVIDFKHRVNKNIYGSSKEHEGTSSRCHNGMRNGQQIETENVSFALRNRLRWSNPSQWC